MSTGAGIGLEVDEGVFGRLEGGTDWSLDASTRDVPGSRESLPP